jgi:HTH-type transcriptional regulator / antitoxin HipB
MKIETIARTPQQLGAAIRRRRNLLGHSQEQISSNTQTRQATLSDLEKGSRNIRLSTLLDILAALDLELVIRERTKGKRDDLESAF